MPSVIVESPSACFIGCALADNADSVAPPAITLRRDSIFAPTLLGNRRKLTCQQSGNKQQQFAGHGPEAATIQLWESKVDLVPLPGFLGWRE
jgi:hypothetical protein